jgi:hypothetical protein
MAASAWGDTPITIPGTISSNGRITATYTFCTTGICQISLAVTDSGGATGRASTIGSSPAQVIIYDPDSKITGGGWFNSPAGALASDPKFTGKANFSFNAQYNHDDDDDDDDNHDNDGHDNNLLDATVLV